LQPQKAVVRTSGRPAASCALLAESNGQTVYFPVVAFIIFAAAYDLSAELTELRVAIRNLRWSRWNEDRSPPHSIRLVAGLTIFAHVGGFAAE
jgi:hypothetical protein